MVHAAAGYRADVAETALTTLHLFGVATGRVPAAVARMALDRAPLSGTTGLEFWKLLGTGDGRTFTGRDHNPRRWGLLAVWTDAGALARFERRSSVARAWAGLAEERWRIDLLPLRSRGRWSGRSPFQTGDPPDLAGPVAAITRARIRWSQSRAFWRAVPPVALDANRTRGLRFAIGVGEAPVGLQGTFSVWGTSRDLADFAYRGQPHRRAIDETSQRRWYAEELFARFAVLQTTGTVEGVDPVAMNPTRS